MDEVLIPSLFRPVEELPSERFTARPEGFAERRPRAFGLLLIILAAAKSSLAVHDSGFDKRQLPLGRLFLVHYARRVLHSLFSLIGVRIDLHFLGISDFSS